MKFTLYARSGFHSVNSSPVIHSTDFEVIRNFYFRRLVRHARDFFEFTKDMPNDALKVHFEFSSLRTYLQYWKLHYYLLIES